MTLWQITSIFGGDTRKLISVSFANSDWIAYGEWLSIFNQLVIDQDRKKLDQELPFEFVKEVLADCDVKFFLSEECIIRSYRLNSEDLELNAVDAFINYGGHALEEALEKGSYKI
jgi:hypothetical protein